LEAGLRTGNPQSPFPEEVNRRLVGQIASLHLAATIGNRENLLREGIEYAKIAVTGNTVIDALFWAVRHPDDYADSALDRLVDDPRKVILVTAHRRESWDAGMANIAHALAELSDRPDTMIVLPIHRNPVVRNAILPIISNRSNILVTEPLTYPAFVRMLSRSYLILTDSGGVQEEGPSLGKPVLVMRDTTERPEAVEAGTAILTGTLKSDIVEGTIRLLDDAASYAAIANAVNPYGDGKAAPRVRAAIRQYFGLGERLADFDPRAGQELRPLDRPAA
jgi:UDP-N-acetylglucosamine 2-epimerase (non-hydrolysing)